MRRDENTLRKAVTSWFKEVHIASNECVNWFWSQEKMNQESDELGDCVDQECISVQEKGRRGLENLSLKNKLADEKVVEKA